MSIEFSELLQNHYGDQPQIWVVGSREQVNHIISDSHLSQHSAQGLIPNQFVNDTDRFGFRPP